MAHGAITAGPDADLDELEHLLTSENIGRIPIVEGERVVGIVTRKDVLRAEHGDAYLDHGLPEERSEATHRFLESVDALLPEDVRGAIREIGSLAEEREVRAYVVGGFVRDMLLGRRNLDVDVVVEGDGIAFAELAAERLGGRVKAHMRFGTAVLVLSKSLHMDVTSARTEYYTRPGALPTVERSSLRQDLLRRDFSINAMAASIDPSEFGEIADPFGGLRDLRRGVDPRAALAVVRGGSDADLARRAVRAALRLPDGGVDGAAGQARGRDGAARRHLRRAHPRRDVRDPGGGAGRGAAAAAGRAGRAGGTAARGRGPARGARGRARDGGDAARDGGLHAGARAPPSDGAAHGDGGAERPARGGEVGRVDARGARERACAGGGGPARRRGC